MPRCNFNICQDSPENFKDLAELSEHLAYVHGRVHSCPVCFVMFASKDALARHRTRVALRCTEKLCVFCPSRRRKDLVTVDEALEHYALCHTDLRLAVCPTPGCDQVFRSVDVMHLHLGSCWDETDAMPAEAPDGSRRKRSWSSTTKTPADIPTLLSQPLKDVLPSTSHTKQGSGSEQCSAEWWERTVSYLTDEHPRKKFYLTQCHLCGHEGKSYEGYVLHCIYIHECSQLCCKCGKMFVEVDDHFCVKRTYRQRKEQRQARYRCLFCFRSFRLKDGLRDHQKIKHHLEWSDCTCPLCDEVFPTEACRKLHMCIGQCGRSMLTDPAVPYLVQEVSRSEAEEIDLYDDADNDNAYTSTEDAQERRVEKAVSVHVKDAVAERKQYARQRKRGNVSKDRSRSLSVEDTVEISPGCGESDALFENEISNGRGVNNLNQLKPGIPYAHVYESGRKKRRCQKRDSSVSSQRVTATVVTQQNAFDAANDASTNEKRKDVNGGSLSDKFVGNDHESNPDRGCSNEDTDITDSAGPGLSFSNLLSSGSQRCKKKIVVKPTAELGSKRNRRRRDVEQVSYLTITDEYDNSAHPRSKLGNSSNEFGPVAQLFECPDSNDKSISRPRYDADEDQPAMSASSAEARLEPVSAISVYACRLCQKGKFTTVKGAMSHVHTTHRIDQPSIDCERFIETKIIELSDDDDEGENVRKKPRRTKQHPLARSPQPPTTVDLDSCTAPVTTQEAAVQTVDKDTPCPECPAVQREVDGLIRVAARFQALAQEALLAAADHDDPLDPIGDDLI